MREREREREGWGRETETRKRHKVREGGREIENGEGHVYMSEI